MINNKKIAIDARMIEMSGIGTYIQHLMGQGIYDVALGDEKVIRKYDADVTVIPFDAKIYSPQEQISFPSRQLKQEHVDVIHFPHYNVPFFYRGKYVVTVHDLIHLVYPQYMRSKVAAMYAKALMTSAVKRANAIFTVSENSRKDISKYFKVPEENIQITYNAVDPLYQKLDPSEYDNLYEKYQIPRDKKVILYVGNLKKHKNITVLLKAFARLKRQDIVLVLAGKAFNDLDVWEQARELGIEKSIVTTGAVGNNSLRGLYNIADLFVFPSLYEGFGIPPLEAMACETPVIASSASSIPEVVGEGALLFNPLDEQELADKIDLVFSDETVRRDLISKGKERAQYFNWDEARRIVKETLARV